MNKTLEEFHDLRTAYGGRIDEAIKNKDDEALSLAKADYKKILEKHMNVACQVLSNHTNKPFSIVKKTHKGTFLKSEKQVLKDTESIRQSLNFVKLTDMELDDIKTSLDIVEDYYNKIVSEKVVGREDQTKFSFQIIYSAIIVPILVTIMSLISGLILNYKLPSYKLIDGLKDFIELSKNGTDSSLWLLILVLVMMGLFAFLTYIFVSKSANSILNKKQFVLLPITIISLFMIITPLKPVYNYLFGPILSNQVIAIMQKISILYFMISGCIIIIYSLIANNYDAGEFKSTINIGHILMLVFVVITFLIPPLFRLACEYINLSVITNNSIFQQVIGFKFLSLIIAIIYIVYLILMIVMKIFFDKRTD